MKNKDEALKPIKKIEIEKAANGWTMKFIRESSWDGKIFVYYTWSEVLAAISETTKEIDTNI